MNCVLETLGGIAFQVRLCQGGASQPGGLSIKTPASRGPIKERNIDFRYSPLHWQNCFGFPDDPCKSLIGERGDLRYGYQYGTYSIAFFSEIVEFSFFGMETDRVVEQTLESPVVPVIRTVLERPEARMSLTAFASNRPDEGRVDNVIMDARPTRRDRVAMVPLVIIKTRRKVKMENTGNIGRVFIGEENPFLFMVVNTSLVHIEDFGFINIFYLGHTAPSHSLQSDPASVITYPGVGAASRNKPFRHLFRFPQQSQEADRITGALNRPDRLLRETRAFWKRWENTRMFERPVSWSLPAQSQAFLTACARNIVQAREVKKGRLSFQVGSATYRGLWVLDGHFILEAAQYLGYGREAREGLDTMWSHQTEEGGVVSGPGRQHWKDTGIALFAMVRQAELSQDWSWFRQKQPDALRAVRFLKKVCDEARAEGATANGRYGLVPRGFGDGGLFGVRDEFTNTVWILAGLRALIQAVDRLQLPDHEDTRRFYEDLRNSFFAAARQEMRRHPSGFRYLPMLMKSDPQWGEKNPLNRPKPQAAQWALSHAIFPGLVFDRNDAIVRGHIALMEACLREDIPAETAWLSNDGAWPYAAVFVSHIYLWLGLPEKARRLFVSFLNHACPLYTWREEQPLRNSLAAKYSGDMPHNWASAMCVLYLRNMLAFEEDSHLRLLAGVTAADLSAGESFRIEGSPTRFGRVGLELKPLPRSRGWCCEFRRGAGPDPVSLQIPSRLGRFRRVEVTGAALERRNGMLFVNPGPSAWTATWR